MSLVAHDVTMRFGGVEALCGVGVTLEPGTTTALIGPNGAGKSTLINCLTGVLRPTAGTILLDGRDVTAEPAERRVVGGLARTFQTPRIDLDSTVRDNVMGGFYARTTSRLVRTALRTPHQRAEERMIDESVDEVLEQFDLLVVASSRAKDLPVWQLRIVEIARAATMGPRYMLLDEPAAGLDTAERDRLGDHIRSLREAGIGVLLVEHNFGFVREMSDQVVVIDRGRPMATGTVDEIAQDPAVIAAYLGGAHHAH